MSPTSRPSSVSGLRRGIGTPKADPDAAAPSAAGDALPPRPEKPVRFTLDLDRTHHLFLKDFALRAERGAAQVMRALLDELEADPDLAARVRARIWQEKR